MRAADATSRGQELEAAEYYTAAGDPAQAAASRARFGAKGIAEVRADLARGEPALALARLVALTGFAIDRAASDELRGQAALALWPKVEARLLPGRFGEAVGYAEALALPLPADNPARKKLDELRARAAAFHLAKAKEFDEAEEPGGLHFHLARAARYGAQNTGVERLAATMHARLGLGITAKVAGGDASCARHAERMANGLKSAGPRSVSVELSLKGCTVDTQHWQTTHQTSHTEYTTKLVDDWEDEYTEERVIVGYTTPMTHSVTNWCGPQKLDTCGSSQESYPASPIYATRRVLVGRRPVQRQVAVPKVVYGTATVSHFSRSVSVTLRAAVRFAEETIEVSGSGTSRFVDSGAGVADERMVERAVEDATTTASNAIRNQVNAAELARIAALFPEAKASEKKLESLYADYVWVGGAGEPRAWLTNHYGEIVGSVDTITIPKTTVDLHTPDLDRAVIPVKHQPGYGARMLLGTSLDFAAGAHAADLDPGATTFGLRASVGAGDGKQGFRLGVAGEAGKIAGGTTGYDVSFVATTALSESKEDQARLLVLAGGVSFGEGRLDSGGPGEAHVRLPLSLTWGLGRAGPLDFALDAHVAPNVLGLFSEIAGGSSAKHITPAGVGATLYFLDHVFARAGAVVPIGADRSTVRIGVEGGFRL